MTKKFFANKKLLKNRYNSRIFMLNIPTVSTGLTLAMVVLFSKGEETIKYYNLIFGLTSLILIYSFVIVGIGSYISAKRIKYNCKDTFIDVVGEYLVVSEFTDARFNRGKMQEYKRLWTIKLSAIEDVYYYDRDIVIMGKGRLIEEQADWLNYSVGRDGPDFEKWWYNENGGKTVHSIELRNKFKYPERIVRVIEHSSGVMRKKEEKRREYREHMLKIAKQLNKTEA